jgi:hypothetical protein
VNQALHIVQEYRDRQRQRHAGACKDIQGECRGMGNRWEYRRIYGMQDNKGNYRETLV